MLFLQPLTLQYLSTTHCSWRFSIPHRCDRRSPLEPVEFLPRNDPRTTEDIYIAPSPNGLHPTPNHGHNDQQRSTTSKTNLAPHHPTHQKPAASHHHRRHSSKGYVASLGLCPRRCRCCRRPPASRGHGRLQLRHLLLQLAQLVPLLQHAGRHGAHGGPQAGLHQPGQVGLRTAAHHRDAGSRAAEVPL